MSKRFALIVVAVLVLAGAAVFALRPPGAVKKQAKSDPAASSQQASAPADAATTSAAPGAADSKSGPRDAGAWTKLTEKYGGSRTSLSKKVTTDLADVLDESLELADMGAQMGGAESAAEAASKGMVSGLVTQLGLTEEQQAKATELVQGAVAKRFAAVKELTGAMRDDPSAMMEMFLAGDATSRNEMTQAEYDEITGGTRQMLQNVGGFVLGRSPDRLGGPLLGDDDFTSQLAAILTPEQQEQLTKYAAEMAAKQEARAGNNQLPLQGGAIPVMDIEKLEATIASAKQMAGGLRQVMEGFQTMKQNTQQPPAP